MKVTLSFMVPSELKKALEQLAESEHRSMSNYCMLALMKHVKEQGIGLDIKKKKARK